MKRSDLEHIIRAASAITNSYELLIIGSQSILGAYPDAPEFLLQSNEADLLLPDGDLFMSDMITGAIGENSMFHDRFGYYAEGVGLDTAVLPPGWQSRLIRIQNENTDLRIGLCLHPLDLAAAKMAAFRDKDLPFVQTMLDAGLITIDELHKACSQLETDEGKKAKIDAWIKSRITTATSRAEPRHDAAPLISPSLGSIFSRSTSQECAKTPETNIACEPHPDGSPGATAPKI